MASELRSAHRFCKRVWKSAKRNHDTLHRPYTWPHCELTGKVHFAIMATELTVQSERAFQKQPHIFLNSKAQTGKSKRKGKGGRRWFKDVGLGFRTPKTAIEGHYIGMFCLRRMNFSLCKVEATTGSEPITNTKTTQLKALIDGGNW